MSLDEWITEKKTALDVFAENWRRGADLDPANYPMDLDPGEWDEQFRVDFE